jgi:hypothetical protein
LIGDGFELLPFSQNLFGPNFFDHLKFGEKKMAGMASVSVHLPVSAILRPFVIPLFEFRPELSLFNY